MHKRNQLLEYAVKEGATDIHICAGSSVLFRIGRKLRSVTEEKLTPQMSKDLSYEFLTDEQRIAFEEQLDYDLMLTCNGARFRINVGYFNGSVGTIVRVLSDEPMSLEEIGLPDVVKSLAKRQKGLVLITGSTSQGKTTTMAAMIDNINKTSRKHIVTIEDPIEYVHRNKNSIVRQREVGTDTQSFCSGLRAALRQDPDVIAIGEMRDYETIKIALTASETGILVLSTLHVISIDKIIERLISYAPDDGENRLRFLLAEALQGVIHQELLPLKKGGQQVAPEIMVTTNAAKNIIRRKGGYHLQTVMSTGKKFGMCTMTESVTDLLDKKLITEDVAKSVLINYST